ncbi:hypothetical protein [Flavobacterium chryseum]|uniref:hypothetical protein n=1 Tax=Flavobacterium sp. P3160 TaxID=2512113 RepID=UPI001FB64856|nr:hypothetical protein [Flavobacterium sp. P3160]
MNTITLADLDQDTASGGNTMLVIMQQLSVSFGVSVASLVLSLFQSGIFEIDKTKAFQYTFIILAIFTILSSITFSRLNKTDGGGYM